MSASLQKESEKYFNSLNTLAEKITIDIKYTREAYQGIWQTLNKQDQDQVINESIISPAAILKYSRIQIPITEDSGSTYSWFTNSQLDLFSHSGDSNYLVDDENIKKQISQKRIIKKKDSIDESYRYKNETIPGQSLSTKSQSIVGLQRASILKPQTPPPPPPSKLVVVPSIISECPAIESDIPKTGFDFLDNW